MIEKESVKMRDQENHQNPGTSTNLRLQPQPQPQPHLQDTKEPMQPRLELTRVDQETWRNT